jgi:hypothetical protein
MTLCVFNAWPQKNQGPWSFLVRGNGIFFIVFTVFISMMLVSNTLG